MAASPTQASLQLNDLQLITQPSKGRQTRKLLEAQYIASTPTLDPPLTDPHEEKPLASALTSVQSLNPSQQEQQQKKIWIGFSNKSQWNWLKFLGILAIFWAIPFAS